MKKSIVTLLLLALTSVSLWAQIPNGYYNNANGKTGDELKVALHNIIKGHHVVSYAGLLNAYAYTDCDANGKIWDIYSNYRFDLNGTCGDYNNEGDCWNREHTWPQSWFNESTTPRSDLFHVYPTDGYVNNRRSNYPYGEVNRPTYTSGNGSKLGPCVTSGYSGTVFEPIDEYKGDIARSYFYMSVRYYSEDSNWGTSGMTNKSEILPWAMTMLLRWSDADPVSDKEIARNNAVYGYQNNRNPFIDHPEYAHMIWDENWQGGVSYNITCATGLSHGSVSAPESAMEGSTVVITATPALGYMVGSYSVYKTGSPSTTVAVSSNGTFTMPGYAVTVSATFVQNNTYYNIAVGNVSHGDISVSSPTAKSGTTINLMATPDNGYSLYSWYVFKTGDMNTTVSVSGNSFVMPAFDVTVMATFVQGNANGNYVKVTSAPNDWSGEYLIVYETGNKAFDGGLTDLDVVSNTITVTISGNTIAANSTTNAAKFTIAAVSGGYSIQAASGKYIGYGSNNNGLTSSNSPLVNTIAFNGDNIGIIGSGGAYLRYNANSGQERFRYFKSSTYTSQKAIQLYKKNASVAAPTHTIHFNENGGSGTMSDQTVNEFEPTALQNNVFTRTGYVFDGWNTMADGTGDFYADGATVTLLDDLTLYAQWNQLFSITVAEVDYGSISANLSEAIVETTITLNATPEVGYEFDHWTVTDALGNLINVTENEFEMPASNVTVSATFVYVGAPFEQKYYLVTSTDQLIDGRTYLIVNKANNKAMGSASSNGNNRTAVEVSILNNTISTLGSACELTLGAEGSNWTLFDANWGENGGYLYAASSGSNYLKTQASYDDNGKWSIGINANGVATIKAQGNNTHNLLRYNNSSNLFSCYTSGQLDVYLFIRSEEYDHAESETLANLFSFDKHTIHNGSTLTVTGTAECNEASYLVIEEGGQFVHSGENVQATLKKGIQAYTEFGGWYTIAVPFGADYDPSGIATDDYDLYAYDEDGDIHGKEWINYEQGGFNLLANQGYLYAHKPATTLRMTGTLNSGNYSPAINLSYGHSSEAMKGWNLLGNPTAHEISFTKTGSVSDGYYYLNNSSEWQYEPNASVPVGRGFLVKANATGQTVTLNPQSKGFRGEKGQYLCLSIGEEKAYVKLNEGVSMPLLDLRGQHSSLYLMHEHKPYIMLVRDEAKTLDLCYEAHNHGTQTLTVDTKGLDLDYLHLIDHKTGEDVDMLALRQAQEPACYTFEASEDDYATRFMLAFAPMDGPSTGSETFAYYADGEIRFVETCHGASVQIVDMTGRIFVCRNAARHISTSGMAPGVYILRLVTDDNVRVQKIVVK